MPFFKIGAACVIAVVFFVKPALGDFFDATFAATGSVSVSAGSPSWHDFNNDGLLDLGAGHHPMRNNGPVGPGGQYTLTNIGGIPSNDHGIFGDYDKDGFVDYFQTGNGILYKNNGGTNFTLQQTFTGMPPNGEGAAWLDINGDTYLDLYVGAHESPTFTYQPDVIYINNQNGTFTKKASFIPGARPAYGVTTADWDQDGDVDVYVSNYRLTNNYLWRNDGSGNFTDAAASHNALGATGHSIGASFGDFNNDGLIDLFAGNFAHSGQPQSRFLINQGSGLDYQFLDDPTGDSNPAAGNQADITYVESYASPTFGDIDNDGDLDLYFSSVNLENSKLWRNNFIESGTLSFTDITATWDIDSTVGTQQTTFGSFGDYNHDGFLDLSTANKILENDGTDNGASLAGNHWLKVSPEGNPIFDATAIGTQVRINVPGLGTLTRQVEGAVGTQGNQNDPDMHFGLGTYSGPLQLEIFWPNGFTEFVNVAGVDQLVTITPGFGDDTWNKNEGGDWNSAGNWIGGVVPNGNAETATFAGSISAPATVTNDQAITLKNMVFTGTNTFAISGTGSINLDSNTGTAAIDVDSGIHMIQIEMTLADDTDIDVASGAKLEFNNDLNLNSMTLTKTGSGEVAFNNDVISNGGTFVCGGGTCTGSSLIGGAMANEGAIVSPGDGIGAMQVNEDFTQDADGTLLVEIGGTRAVREHDLLYVGGTLNADGTVAVVLADGYMPAAGDEFDVLDFGAIVGEFALDLPDLGDNLTWSTGQLYSFGVLGITAIPEPGTLAGSLWCLAALTFCRRRQGTRR